MGEEREQFVPEEETSKETGTEQCQKFIAEADSLKGRFSHLSYEGSYEQMLNEIKSNPEDPIAKEAAEKLEEIVADYLTTSLRKEDLDMRLARVGRDMKDLYIKMKKVFEITGSLSKYEAQLEELKQAYNDYWTKQGEATRDTLISD